MSSQAITPKSASTGEAESVPTPTASVTQATERPWWEGQFGKPGQMHTEDKGFRKLSDIGG